MNKSLASYALPLIIVVQIKFKDSCLTLTSLSVDNFSSCFGYTDFINSLVNSGPSAVMLLKTQREFLTNCLLSLYKFWHKICVILLVMPLSKIPKSENLKIDPIYFKT